MKGWKMQALQACTPLHKSVQRCTPVARVRLRAAPVFAPILRAPSKTGTQARVLLSGGRNSLSSDTEKRLTELIDRWSEFRASESVVKRRAWARV